MYPFLLIGDALEKMGYDRYTRFELVPKNTDKVVTDNIDEIKEKAQKYDELYQRAIELEKKL